MKLPSEGRDMYAEEAHATAQAHAHKVQRNMEIEQLRCSRMTRLTKLADALTDAHGYGVVTIIDSSVADTAPVARLHPTREDPTPNVDHNLLKTPTNTKHLLIQKQKNTNNMNLCIHVPRKWEYVFRNRSPFVAHLFLKYIRSGGWRVGRGKQQTNNNNNNSKQTRTKTNQQ